MLEYKAMRPEGLSGPDTRALAPICWVKILLRAWISSHVFREAQTGEGTRSPA